MKSINDIIDVLFIKFIIYKHMSPIHLKLFLLFICFCLTIKEKTKITNFENKVTH